MRNEFVNDARDLFDGAVAVVILPRVDLLWYNYAYMEELMENVAYCRVVFDLWMELRESSRSYGAVY